MKRAALLLAATITSASFAPAISPTELGAFLAGVHSPAALLICGAAELRGCGVAGLRGTVCP